MIDRTNKLDTPDKIELFGKNANEKIELHESMDFSAMEAKLKGLFENLTLVGNPEKDSLEDILNKAIVEGERFIEWKNSDRPLPNIQIFHKIDGNLVRYNPPKPPQFSFFKLFESTGDFEITENSQLEIWECDEKGEPYFPLQRIHLSNFREDEKVFINEKLRDHCWLKMKIQRQKSSVSFSFTIDHSEQKPNQAISLDKRTGFFIYDLFRNLLQWKIPAISYVYAFCFTLMFFSFSVNIVYAKEANSVQESLTSNINRYKDTKTWTFKLSNTEQIKPSGGA